MLAHAKKACVAQREKFEFLLVKLNDQHFSSRPEGLIVALQHYFLIGREIFPSRVAILFSIENWGYQKT